MARLGRPRKVSRERLDHMVRFGVTSETMRALREHKQNGEQVNAVARRLIVERLAQLAEHAA